MIHVVKIDNKQKSRRNVNFYIFQFWVLGIFAYHIHSQSIHASNKQYTHCIYTSTSMRQICLHLAPRQNVCVNMFGCIQWDFLLGVLNEKDETRDGFHQTNIRSCYSIQLIKFVVSDHDRFNMELIYVVLVQRNHRERKR